MAASVIGLPREPLQRDMAVNAASACGVTPMGLRWALSAHLALSLRIFGVE